MVQTIQINMKNTLTNLTRYLKKWKRFAKVWKADKVFLYKLRKIMTFYDYKEKHKLVKFQLI